MKPEIKLYLKQLIEAFLIIIIIGSLGIAGYFLHKNNSKPVAPRLLGGIQPPNGAKIEIFEFTSGDMNCVTVVSYSLDSSFAHNSLSCR